MSVNGLDGISSSARKDDERKSSAPFELQSNCIHDVHEQCHQQSHRAFIPTIHSGSAIYVTSHVQKKKHHAPQRRRSKAHRAPDIHRVAQHIKRKPLNTMVHQYTEIVAEERARDPERPRRAHDERLPRDEERCGQERVERCGKQRYARLFEKRAAVSAGRG